MYGFKRIVRGDDIGAYIHPAFKRKREDLLPLVRRISMGHNKELEELGPALTNVRSKRKLDPHAQFQESRSKYHQSSSSGRRSYSEGMMTAIATNATATSNNSIWTTPSPGAQTRCRKSRCVSMVEQQQPLTTFGEREANLVYSSPVVVNNSMANPFTPIGRFFHPQNLHPSSPSQQQVGDFDFDCLGDEEEEEPGRSSSVSSLFYDDSSDFTTQVSGGHHAYCDSEATSDPGDIFSDSREVEMALNTSASVMEAAVRYGSPKTSSPKAVHYFPAHVYLDGTTTTGTSVPSVFPDAFPFLDLLDESYVIAGSAGSAARPVVGRHDSLFGKSIQAAFSSSADMTCGSGSTAHEASTLCSSSSGSLGYHDMVITPRPTMRMQKTSSAHCHSHFADEALDDDYLMEVLLDLN